MALMDLFSQNPVIDQAALTEIDLIPSFLQGNSKTPEFSDMSELPSFSSDDEIAHYKWMAIHSLCSFLYMERQEEFLGQLHPFLNEESILREIDLVPMSALVSYTANNYDMIIPYVIAESALQDETVYNALDQIVWKWYPEYGEKYLPDRELALSLYKAMTQMTKNDPEGRKKAVILAFRILQPKALSVARQMDEDCVRVTGLAYTQDPYSLIYSASTEFYKYLGYDPIDKEDMRVCSQNKQVIKFMTKQATRAVKALGIPVNEPRDPDVFRKLSSFFNEILQKFKSKQYIGNFYMREIQFCEKKKNPYPVVSHNRNDLFAAFLADLKFPIADFSQILLAGKEAEEWTMQQCVWAVTSAYVVTFVPKEMITLSTLGYQASIPEEELQDYANSIFTYYILNLCAEMNKSKNLMISKLELELTFQKSKGKHSAAIYQELQDCRQKIQQLEADAEKMAERHQEQENAFKKEKDALTASYISATAELRRKSKNLEEENEKLRAELKRAVQKQNDSEKAAINKKELPLPEKEGSWKEKLQQFKDSRILIVGGHLLTVKEIKEHIPGCRVIENKTDPLPDFHSLDGVVLFPSFMNHSMYSNVMRQIRITKIPYCYINTKNIDQVSSELVPFLNRLASNKN